MTNQYYIDLENRYGAGNYLPLDVVITRGKGIWVWDVEGNRYMDCLSAYSAVNQGHCHPEIMKALVEQASRLTLTSRAFRNDQLGPFYEELNALTGYEMILPMNSGAEAVETMIKAVRKWGYSIKGIPHDKAEIIVCENNFHGRTITLVGFSSDEPYRNGFGPFAAGFTSIPFGDPEALKRAIEPHTVGLLLEPIQGEGGVILPPPGYLKEARELCDSNNIKLMLDEIQTGLGRTGKTLAQEHEGIRADAVVVGKALSGGFYPVSAVLANRDILGVFNPGEHGSTFGGNPLACAVARRALRVLVDEGLVENAAVMGDYFLTQLNKLKGSLIKEVRGKGLMIGVELQPEAGVARHYCEKFMAKGLLCKETHDHVIRIAPPLLIQRDEVDWAMEKIDSVLGEQ
jgi:ornithine--oxo-acid transaminase